MPFGDIRKFAKKEAKRQKRAIRRNRGTASRMQITNVVNSLAEKKYHQTGANQVITTTSTTATQLSAVPSQTTLASKTVRIGDVINPTSLKWGYIIQNADSSDQYARIIVVQWHNDSVPLLAEVIQDIGVKQNLHSSYAQNIKNRFTVLFDKVHVMPIAANTSQKASKQINKLTKIRFNAAPNTSGSGNIYFFAFGTATTGVGLDYYGNLRFIDM